VHHVGRPPRDSSRRLADEGMRSQQNGDAFFRDLSPGRTHRGQNQAQSQENSSKTRDQPASPNVRETTDVVQRYGKWRSELEGKPQLSDLLHKEGYQGLNSFGYEPPRRFADRRRTGEGIFCEAVCTTDS
jgi:hypothetical protein